MFRKSRHPKTFKFVFWDANGLGSHKFEQKNTYQSSIYYILIILSLCCGEEDLSRIEIDSAALSVWIYANLVYPLFLLFFPVQISNWYPLWSHNLTSCSSRNFVQFLKELGVSQHEFSTSFIQGGAPQLQVAWVEPSYKYVHHKTYLSEFN